MAKFIEVHNSSGGKVLVNLDWVEYVTPHINHPDPIVHARILMAYHDDDCDSDFTDTTESYEQVLTIIGNATGGISRDRG